MGKAILIGAATAAIVVGGCSRGHAEDGGPTVQRSYKVGDFKQVEAAGPFNVTVHTGAAPSVSASGNEKLIERLVVEVRGDKLVIHTERRHGMFNWGWGTSGSANIAVTVPALTGATLAGSGGITIDSVKGDNFEGAVAGSGDLNIDSIEVQSLKLSIAGSGDVRAKGGQARVAEFEIAGSGGIDARSVRSEVATATIMGSGSINGQATGTGDVTIMGSGDVTLTGGAKCSITKHGSGDVHCS